jgi:hypothetical protein
VSKNKNAQMPSKRHVHVDKIPNNGHASENFSPHARARVYMSTHIGSHVLQRVESGRKESIPARSIVVVIVATCAAADDDDYDNYSTLYDMSN